MFKSFISIALLLFSSIIHASTVPNIKITLDGKIWATVHKGSYQSTTRPLFGDEMDALCGREEQGCVGTSSTGVNLTGWKWASEASIIDLANSILPQPLDIPANFTRNEDTSSFLDIFGITAIDEGIGFFLGYGATKTDKRNSTYLPTLDIWANCGGVTISIYCAGDIHRLGQAHLTKRGGAA